MVFYLPVLGFFECIFALISQASGRWGKRFENHIPVHQAAEHAVSLINLSFLWLRI